uniref:Uncharacterized protein n=1 Tax=Salix viminalis TaxID=40686 RepID=A0A6N2NI28_SALVM
MEIDKSASSMKNDVENASASNIDADTNKANMKKKKENSRICAILERLKNQSPPPKDRAAIFKVPYSLRVSNPEAYTPQLISIGPFHHDSERLEAMEMRKKDIKEKSIDNIDKDSFVRMIVLDAVFIIEFLKDSCDDGFPKNIDARMRFCIEEDLMLLENQLPFSILDLVYSEFYHHSQDENKTPLLDLATRHFVRHYPLAHWPKYTTAKAQHFTDLLMNLMLEGKLERKIRYCPVKLKYNAASFAKQKGVLKIPILTVDDSLERLVRNVMAWEQCSKPDEAYICNYFRFMDHLINTAEDVDLLIEEEIIINCLSDSESVSNLMNNLSPRSETASYYSDICRELNEHYKKPWNRSKATLKLVYFSNIWRGTGTVAAAFLLILTVLQTITSLKSAF